MNPSRLRGILLAVLTSVVWGTVPIAGKVALGGMTAPLLSTVRLLLAAGFIALVLWRRRELVMRRPPKLVYVCALGLAGNYVIYMWGLERAGAAVAQVLIQAAPLFLVGLSVWWLRERMTGWQVAGGAVAIMGMFLVSWREAAGESRAAAGMILILVAAASWSFYAVAHKRLGRDHPSGPTMMWTFALAGLLLVPVAAVEPVRSPDGPQIAAIAYLCVNTVVAYWAFAESLRHIPAGTAAVICTLGPVVTFGLIALNNHLGIERLPREPVTGAMIGGAALVIGGVSLTVLGTRTRRRRPLP